MNELGKAMGYGQKNVLSRGRNATGCVPPYTGPLWGMCEAEQRGARGECACPKEGENEARMAGLFFLASMALVYLIYDGVVGRVEKTEYYLSHAGTEDAHLVPAASMIDRTT